MTTVQHVMAASSFWATDKENKGKWKGRISEMG